MDGWTDRWMNTWMGNIITDYASAAEEVIDTAIK